MAEDETLLTVEDLEARWRVHQNTVRLYVRNDGLRAVRLGKGRTMRFRLEDVLAFEERKPQVREDKNGT